MKLFDVYPLLNVTPEKAKGCYVWDKNGTKYLDLYGGHGVISIGHSHPTYIDRVTEQLNKIGYYSNSVQNELQEELAKKVGEISGYSDYNLFLCNSGAEANENALKLASFHTGKKEVIAFHNAFHGRTSGSVAITDNKKIQAPFNQSHEVIFLELEDFNGLQNEITNGDVAAVIIEGIQGIGGLDQASEEFIKFVEEICNANEVVLILDEIQSGYGRTGNFFAHQEFGIKPHLITVAKGMGNGFPIGGVLINPMFEPGHGLLGTTFGGNHLACAAANAVIDVIANEELIRNATAMGEYIKAKFADLPGLSRIKGKGLMLGFEFNFEIKALRSMLLTEHHVLTGTAKSPNMLRILPPMSITKSDVNKFYELLETTLKKITKDEAVCISE